MVIERFVLLGLLLTLVAACASTSDRIGEANEVDCLYMRQVVKNLSIDDWHVSVATTKGDQFLVTLAGECPILTSWKLGFPYRYRTSGLLCTHNFPDISRDDYAGHIIRCRVSRVEPIESEEQGEAIAEGRSAVYQLADDFSDAWNAGDAASVSAMFMESASLSIDESDTVEGREAIKAAIGRLMAATPELHVAVLDIDDQSESLTLSWSWSEALPQRGENPVIAGQQVWQLSADAEIESATIRTRAEPGD